MTPSHPSAMAHTDEAAATATGGGPRRARLMAAVLVGAAAVAATPGATAEVVNLPAGTTSRRGDLVRVVKARMQLSGTQGRVGGVVTGEVSFDEVAGTIEVANPLPCPVRDVKVKVSLARDPGLAADVSIGSQRRAGRQGRAAADSDAEGRRPHRPPARAGEGVGGDKRRAGGGAVFCGDGGDPAEAARGCWTGTAARPRRRLLLDGNRELRVDRLPLQAAVGVAATGGPADRAAA